MVTVAMVTVAMVTVAMVTVAIVCTVLCKLCVVFIFFVCKLACKVNANIKVIITCPIIKRVIKLTFLTETLNFGLAFFGCKLII